MLLSQSRHGKRIRRKLAGTAAIEFGIAIPLLAILVTAIVEIGFSIYQAMQVTVAAEAGLFYAAKSGWSASGIENAAVSATPLSGMSAAATQFCGCPSSTGIATVTSCTAACSSGYLPSQYISIAVTLTRRSVILNSGYSLPSTLSAQSILRQN
jgi:Flp pilus assembly protein TadG